METDVSIILTVADDGVWFDFQGLENLKEGTEKYRHFMGVCIVNSLFEEPIGEWFVESLESKEEPILENIIKECRAAMTRADEAERQWGKPVVHPTEVLFD